MPRMTHSYKALQPSRVERQRKFGLVNNQGRLGNVDVQRTVQRASLCVGFVDAGGGGGPWVDRCALFVLSVGVIFLCFVVCVFFFCGHVVFFSRGVCRTAPNKTNEPPGCS